MRAFVTMRKTLLAIGCAARKCVAPMAGKRCDSQLQFPGPGVSGMVQLT